MPNKTTPAKPDETRDAERVGLYIVVSREVNGAREHRKVGVPLSIERAGESAVDAFIAALTPAQWDAAAMWTHAPAVGTAPPDTTTED